MKTIRLTVKGEAVRFNLNEINFITTFEHQASVNVNGIKDNIIVDELFYFVRDNIYHTFFNSNSSSGVEVIVNPDAIKFMKRGANYSTTLLHFGNNVVLEVDVDLDYIQ